MLRFGYRDGTEADVEIGADGPALLSGATEAIGGDEPAAESVGCWAQAPSSRTARTALIGVRAMPFVLTSAGRNGGRAGCTRPPEEERTCPTGWASCDHSP